ncbi:hypothetical protein BKH16_06900 [Actinomyces oris]|nr:hypothetical protein BKH16_06900 [Actinomyces oris]
MPAAYDVGPTWDTRAPPAAAARIRRRPEPPARSGAADPGRIGTAVSKMDTKAVRSAECARRNRMILRFLRVTAELRSLFVTDLDIRAP